MPKRQRPWLCNMQDLWQAGLERMQKRGLSRELQPQLHGRAASRSDVTESTRDGFVVLTDGL